MGDEGCYLTDKVLQVAERFEAVENDVVIDPDVFVD
jgi:hypothetical protein